MLTSDRQHLFIFRLIIILFDSYLHKNALQVITLKKIMNKKIIINHYLNK